MAIKKEGISGEIIAPHKPRIKLDYLDGLRGLAAFYVLIFHASQASQIYITHNTLVGHSAKIIVRSLTLAHYLVIGYGHYAVDIFIVLSGYCLMLPVIQSDRNYLRGGVREFIKRRARRILPPYYAALLLSLVIFVSIRVLNKPLRDSYWNVALPAVTPSALISHLLLIHNWGTSALKIDPPMWSVAVEWQIYFLFPLLLLPVWRRFNGTVTVVVAFAVALLPYYIFHSYMRDTYIYSWFLGLFALGMLGAEVGFGSRSLWMRNLGWEYIAGLSTLTVITLQLVQRKSWAGKPALHWVRFETWGTDWPVDVLVGTAAIALIIHLTDAVSKSPSKQGALTACLLYILQSRLAIGLGAFSYSLYLIHTPILYCIDMGSRHFAFSVTQSCLALFGLGIPLSLFGAYTFYLLFERPFMSKNSGKLWLHLNRNNSQTSTGDEEHLDSTMVAKRL